VGTSRLPHEVRYGRLSLPCELFENVELFGLHQNLDALGLGHTANMHICMCTSRVVDKPRWARTSRHRRAQANKHSLEPGIPIVTVVSPARSGLCFGDSGGPAFASVEGALARVGVLSNGNPSCDGGDNYVSVPLFSSWIRETADDLGQAMDE
jgi:Trypsin